MRDNDLMKLTLADLFEAFAKTVDDRVQIGLAQALKKFERPTPAPAASSSLIPVREARRRLPCGCRTEHLYEALKCGALRGRQQQHGRRAWLVDADDLQRWDAAGRPLTHLAVVTRRSA